MPNEMVALSNTSGALCAMPQSFAPTARLLCSNTASRRVQDLEDAKCSLHVSKIRYGATATENVYIVYQPR